MTDFELQVKALKIKWVNRLTSSQNECWAHVATSILDNICPNINVLMHANFTDMKQLLLHPKVTPFYIELLRAWCEMKAGIQEKTNESVCDIRSQLIWGNKYISPRNHVLFFKHWIDNGIIRINDICTERGFLDIQTLIEKVPNKPNVLMEFKTILEAMPLRWRETVRTQTCALDVIEFNHTPFKKNLSEYLKAKQFIKPCVELKWEMQFGISIAWHHVWRRKICLRDKKLAQFNYKLLHNILPNMKQLKIWQIVQDDNCILCHTVEDASHLFAQCPRVKPFWTNIEQLIDQLLNQKIICSWETILLGINSSNENMNIIITLAAFTVFKTWAIADKDAQLLKNIDVWLMFMNEVKQRAAILNELNICENVFQTIIDRE